MAGSRTDIPVERWPRPRWEVPYRRQYRLRFAAIYLALAGVLVASLTATMLLIISAPNEARKTWSVWNPRPGTIGAVTSSVAAHVSSEYRVSETGARLVSVAVKSPPMVSGVAGPVPVSLVAVRPPLRSRSGIRMLDAGSVVAYSLCGRGAGCAVAAGTTGGTRARLVRREALELALTTMKAIPTVTSVLAFPPPPPGGRAGTVLFFERAALSRQLDQPLVDTLPLRHPPVPSDPDAVEARRIDSLTLPRLYRYHLVQLPMGAMVLVLDRSR